MSYFLLDTNKSTLNLRVDGPFGDVKPFLQHHNRELCPDPY